VYENGDREPCTWIQIDGRDVDVQRIARNRREAPLPPRSLEAREYIGEIDRSCLHVQAVADWTCPICPACCGQSKIHTLTIGCHHARKEELRRDRECRARFLALLREHTSDQRWDWAPPYHDRDL